MKRLFYTIAGLLAIVVLSLITNYYVRAAATNGLTGTGSGHRQVIANTNGLVGWWKFDGDATDASINQNDGTTAGSPGYVSGEFGQAISLNGTTQSLSMTAATGVPSGTSAVTFSTWLNATSLPTSGNEMTLLRYGATANQANFELRNNSGTQQLCARTSATNYDCINYTLTTSTWYLLTVVFDGTNLNYYVNGVLQGSLVSALNTATVTSINVGSPNGSGSFFAGLLDDMRIYSRTLSQTEITQLYQGSSPTSCDQSCIGYWKFDEAGGNTARDTTLASGNALTDVGDVASGTGKLGNDAVFVAASTQYLKTTPAASTNLSPGAGDFSYALWMKPTSHTLNTDVLYDGSSGPTVPGFGLRLTSSGLLTALFADGTNRAAFNSATTLSNGTWYYIVVTGSRAGNMTIYVNGTSDSSASITTENQSAVQSSTGLELGFGSGTSNYFDGALDEVGIWHRALTSTEITDMYNSGSGKSLGNFTAAETQSLGSYWSLDEFSAGTGLVQRNDSYSGASQVANSFTAGTDGWTSGVFSNALQFNGTSDYVATPNLPTTSSMSVSLWINQNPSSSAFARLVGTNTNGPALGIGTNGGLYFQLVNSGGTYSTDNAHPIATPGSWSYITLVINGTSVSLYINGVLANNYTSAVSLSSGTFSNYIGADGPSGQFFYGSLDDVRIYNRALQPYEVYDQYLAGRS